MEPLYPPKMNTWLPTDSAAVYPLPVGRTVSSTLSKSMMSEPYLPPNTYTCVPIEAAEASSFALGSATSSFLVLSVEDAGLTPSVYRSAKRVPSFDLLPQTNARICFLVRSFHFPLLSICACGCRNPTQLVLCTPHGRGEVLGRQCGKGRVSFYHRVCASFLC